MVIQNLSLITLPPVYERLLLIMVLMVLKGLATTLSPTMATLLLLPTFTHWNFSLNVLALMHTQQPPRTLILTH
jgi:hypothetical protein